MKNMGINKVASVFALASTIVTGGCDDGKCENWLRQTDNGAHGLSVTPEDAARITDKDAHCYCKGVAKARPEWGMGQSIDRGLDRDLRSDVYGECFSQLTGVRDGILAVAGEIVVKTEESK